MPDTSTPISPARGLLIDAEISAAAWRVIRERDARLRAARRRQAAIECTAVLIFLAGYALWCFMGGLVFQSPFGY